MVPSHFAGLEAQRNCYCVKPICLKSVFPLSVLPQVGGEFREMRHDRPRYFSLVGVTVAANSLFHGAWGKLNDWESFPVDDRHNGSGKDVENRCRALFRKQGLLDDDYGRSKVLQEAKNLCAPIRKNLAPRCPARKHFDRVAQKVIALKNGNAHFPRAGVNREDALWTPGHYVEVSGLSTTLCSGGRHAKANESASKMFDR
jgi:hypothetical protein